MKKLLKNFLIMLLDFENPIRNFPKAYIGASKINAKNNKRKMMIAYLSLASTLLAGCNSNNNINQNTTEYINEKTTSEITTEIITTEASTQMTEESTTTEIKEELTTSENITETETTEEIMAQETNSSDEQIINEMNNDKNNIELYITQNDIENVKTYGKAFFVKTVDFIFYDKDINGIKFNDLKEETKEDVYNAFCNIDALIMTFSPDYKENIGEKYEIVKDFTSNVYYSSLDKIKQSIGEENYNKIGEIKDNAKEKIKEGTNNAKEYIKEKYENWRDK